MSSQDSPSRREYRERASEESMNDPRESSSGSAAVVALVVVLLLLIPCGLAVVFLGGTFFYMSRAVPSPPPQAWKAIPQPVMPAPPVTIMPPASIEVQETPLLPESPPAGPIENPAGENPANEQTDQPSTTESGPSAASSEGS
jgi:hypothetical protein